MNPLTIIYTRYRLNRMRKELDLWILGFVLLLCLLVIMGAIMWYVNETRPDYTPRQVYVR